MAEQKQKGSAMKVLKKHPQIPLFLSPFFLFSVILAFIVAMPLVSAGVTVGRDVTLQWDVSIDAPNLLSHDLLEVLRDRTLCGKNKAYNLPEVTPLDFPSLLGDTDIGFHTCFRRDILLSLGFFH